MQLDVFELAFSDDVDLPGPDAADHVLVRWLVRRLGREPSWLEVLALRAALQERERRRVRWAWWRRWLAPVPPSEDDLVADFLRSWEGQVLYRLVGGMAELWAQLALSDPWKEFDGRHPHAPRPTRQETLRERAALGFVLPMREQVSAVLAYAEWKLGDETGSSMETHDAAEFVLPAHAAAINVLSETAVIGVCARLQYAKGNEIARREVLRELDRVGSAAMTLWPGVGRLTSEVPLGNWPPRETNGPEEPPTSISSPPDFTR